MLNRVILVWIGGALMRGVTITCYSHPNLPFIICSCGYNQEIPDSSHPPFADGVLGLGIGKSSVLEQLHNLGLTRNVVGHCLSTKGGGFLFFGDDFVPSSGIVWAPFSSKKLEWDISSLRVHVFNIMYIYMCIYIYHLLWVNLFSHNVFRHHYSLGPADLHFGGQATGVKGLYVVFDSGSTYSYFNSDVYNAVVSQVRWILNLFILYVYIVLNLFNFKLLLLVPFR